MTSGIIPGFTELNELAHFLEWVVGPKVLEIRARGALGTEEKRDFKDIKTDGDTTAERLIKNYLRAQFPRHGIRGEEGTSVCGDGEYEWVVDPIDGTTNYASGMPLFGISCGLLRNGVPFAGVIHYPALGRTAYAVSDRGVYSGPVLEAWPIRVRPYSGNRNEFLVAVGLGGHEEFLFPTFFGRSANVLALGSFVYEALMVAEGRLKGYVSTSATPFDMAAAIVIVREAGGVAVHIESDELVVPKGEEKASVILACDMSVVEHIREAIRDGHVRLAQLRKEMRTYRDMLPDGLEDKDVAARAFRDLLGVDV
jgi:fructose-1,6-bisphosphatase/inositol monophosphatase family enzyme